MKTICFEENKTKQPSGPISANPWCTVKMTKMLKMRTYANVVICNIININGTIFAMTQFRSKLFVRSLLLPLV